MIDVSGVTKHYGSVRAVEEVSFRVPRGAVVGVLGPNGAGKSTTVRMIAGTVPPTRGSVSVDGLDSVADSEKLRRRLGYLPESNPLYPEMRVVEYLRYRGRLHGLGGREGKRAVDEAIERCWLGEMRRRRIGALSKGYRQRVGLAAALLHDPSVLLLDEPTSGLDPAQIRETRSLIRSLAGDRTALIVSHALAEVEKTCDRLLIFAGGRLRAEGDAEELVSKHGPGNVWDVSVELKNGLTRGELLKRFGAVAGVKSAVERASDGPVGEREKTGSASASGDGDWLDAVVTFTEERADAGERLGAVAASAGLGVRRLGRRAASLEEVYIGLVSSARDDAAARSAGDGVAAGDAAEQQAPEASGAGDRAMEGVS